MASCLPIVFLKMNVSVSYKVVSYLRDSNVIQITGQFSLSFVTVHVSSYCSLEL